MKFPKKVAIVTDSMIAFGGADRFLFTFLKIFPDAHIYTLKFKRGQYPNLKNNVYTSFLDKFPFKQIFKRNLNVLNPLLFELFDLDKYELVISLTAGSAKGVITSPYQKHISFILTPPRLLWDGEINIRASVLKYLYRPISPLLTHYLRLWDIGAINRVDSIVTISKYIQKKIMKIYRRESTVIYPGIAKFWFEKDNEDVRKRVLNSYNLPKEYLLVVSRLYDYKKIDLAIECALETDKNLVVVGSGPDLSYLKKKAGGSKKILFLGNVSDSDLRVIYGSAQTLIFAGVEDFGLVPVECMATGTPVLAFEDGGVVETVVDGVSGAFFNTKEQLLKLIKSNVWRKYDKSEIIKCARKFSEEKTVLNIKKYIESEYEKA